MKRTVYIAGPMSSLPRFNYPAFHKAEREWRAAGWDVENPAKSFKGRTDHPRPMYIRAAIEKLLKCTDIVMLKGWQNSPGALLELAIAKELNLIIHYEQGGESVLQEALRITSNARQKDYGHPRDDFGKTACMWDALLRDRLKPGAIIKASDIPMFMICVKLARETNRHKRDNCVDIAGYARTLAMVENDE